MEHPYLSITQQCALLSLNRSSFYVKPRLLKPNDQALLNPMDKIFTEHPYYGHRRMMHVRSA